MDEYTNNFADKGQLTHTEDRKINEGGKMNSKLINQFLKENWRMSYEELASQTGLNTDAVRKRYRNLKLPHKRINTQNASKLLTTNQQIERDISIDRLSEQGSTLKKKYEALLSQFTATKAERDAVKQIQDISTHVIHPDKHEQSEAVAFAIASDWHIEEDVRPETINDLNTYTLAVAKNRGEEFFKNTIRLVQIFQKDTKINTLVLGLLGDFISGSIHDELAESNQLPPVMATIEAQNWLASGIQHILDHTNLNLILPCHSGNHARSTKEQRHATEAGNSFEYFMYHALANHFRGNKRVKFIISEGYHSYVTAFDFTVRFHHGHSINYGGGVGGIFIPVFKAIAQWNKARKVDLDVFGHFHQFRDGGNFICNGSMIGYNAYALSIKAEYEKPKQAFFLVDKKRGKTVVCPILFS